MTTDGTGHSHGDELDRGEHRQQLEEARRTIEQLEAKLSDNWAAFESALELQPNGIIVVDADGNVRAMNETAREIWGDPPAVETLEDLASFPLILPDGTSISADRPLEHCLRDEEISRPRDVEIERFDGRAAVILYSASPYYGAEDELRGAIGLFTDITDLKRLQEAHLRARRTAEEAASRMADLQEITAELFDALSPAEAVRIGVEHAHRLLDADRSAGYLRVGDRTLETVVEHNYEGRIDGYRTIDLDDAVPVAESVRLDTSIFIADPDAFRERYPNLALRTDTTSSEAFAAIPLVVHGDVVGTLVLGYDQPHSFDQSERVFLQTLGDQCAHAIHRAELYQSQQTARSEADRRADQQEAVAHLARRALEVETDELFDEALQLLVDVLEADTAKLLEYRADKTFVLRAGIGWDDAWLGANLGPPDDNTAVGRALLENEVVIIEDLSDTPFGPTDLVEAHGLASAMTVQIPGHPQPFGAIGIHAYEPQSFTQLDSQFIRSISNVLSDAIEKERAEHQREMTYQRLFEAMRDREQLLSVVSHDLRSPATSVRMNLGLIERQLQKLDNDESCELIREAVYAAEGSIERMVEMMTNMLDLAREETEQQGLTLEPVNFGEMTCDVLARLNGEAAQSESTLRTDIEPDIEGFCDRVRFEQITTNLLSNAFKYGEHEPIELSVRPSDNDVEMVIRDHGVGIPPEEQAHIFERFQRGDSSERADSFGLGLWIVRESVDALGGSIEFDSEPGEGTEFRVRLPLEPDAE